MQLHEKYRPIVWGEVIGQDKAVAALQAVGARGWGGRAYFLSGQSGVGKTTLARLIAAEVADGFYVAELDATDLTPAKLREVESTMGLCGGGRGGRAWIVNEAHGLRRDTLRQLLVLLERLPSHVAVIFTTTKDGQESLFEDEADAHPLLSRCVVVSLTSQGLALRFAHRAREIAQLEGLDGQPPAAYLARIKHHKNNLRALLQDVDKGHFARSEAP
ncbi:MAG: AAA family ATPase [Nitrospiraceae bacterium]